MNSQKLTAALVLMLLALVAVFGGRTLREKGVQLWVSGAGAAQRVKGNPGADLKIVEHIDYQCGACREAALVLGDYQKKYPERFQIEVKFHPLSGHPHGLLSAVYAECAARQQKFWAFHEGLFERQAEWSPQTNPVGVFREVALKAGANLKSLEACVDDEKTRDSVMKEKAEGTAKGIQMTPTFFFNGKMLVGTRALLEELGQQFPHERKAGKAA